MTMNRIKRPDPGLGVEPVQEFGVEIVGGGERFLFVVRYFTGTSL